MNILIYILFKYHITSVEKSDYKLTPRLRKTSMLGKRCNHLTQIRSFFK